MILGIVSWLVVAVIVGFIASKVVDLRGDDPRLGLAASCAGSIVAAVLYTVISGSAVSARNPWALLAAATGAAIGVFAGHAIRSRSISRESYSRRNSYSTTGR